MRTRATWVWMILMVACGGSGSETPPPVEPTTPAWSDRESDEDPRAGKDPVATTPTEREGSDELVPPQDAE